MTWHLCDRLLASLASDQSVCFEKDDSNSVTYAELGALSGRIAN